MVCVRARVCVCVCVSFVRLMDRAIPLALVRTALDSLPLIQSRQQMTKCYIKFK